MIDGQGGGIGAAIIKELRQTLGETLEIWALGANAQATANMMKARANRGATGENAWRQSLTKVRVIMGPVATSWPNSMMGEISPAMAEAVMSSSASKIFIPLALEDVVLSGFKSEPLPHLIAAGIKHLQEIWSEQKIERA